MDELTELVQSKVNFHTKLNSQDYLDNQRLYTKLIYIYQAEQKYGKNLFYEQSIDLYFQSLDKYPKYREKCEKAAKLQMQKTGYKSPPSLDSEPDHNYAGRMSGISRDYILQLFHGYYLRSDASTPEKNENKEYLDNLDFMYK